MIAHEYIALLLSNETVTFDSPSMEYTNPLTTFDEPALVYEES